MRRDMQRIQLDMDPQLQMRREVEIHGSLDLLYTKRDTFHFYLLWQFIKNSKGFYIPGQPPLVIEKNNWNKIPKIFYNERGTGIGTRKGDHLTVNNKPTIGNLHNSKAFSRALKNAKKSFIIEIENFFCNFRPLFRNESNLQSQLLRNRRTDTRLE